MTTTQPFADALRGGDRTGGRSARLAQAVRGLRTRASTAEVQRWLLIVGGILMPLGILLIILGWLGAAHTPLPFEQTPYLISGGLLGLALVFAGGFVYFAYWETVRIRDSRSQSQELLAALGRVEALLSGGAATTASGAHRGGTATATAAFVATPTGSIFHRPECSVVAGRTDLSSVDPKRTKLEPCRICNPLAD